MDGLTQSKVTFRNSLHRSRAQESKSHPRSLDGWIIYYYLNKRCMDELKAKSRSVILFIDRARRNQNPARVLLDESKKKTRLPGLALSSLFL
jgi:hypothetical protein